MPGRKTRSQSVGGNYDSISSGDTKSASHSENAKSSSVAVNSPPTSSLRSSARTARGGGATVASMPPNDGRARFPSSSKSASNSPVGSKASGMLARTNTTPMSIDVVRLDAARCLQSGQAEVGPLRKLMQLWFTSLSLQERARVLTFEDQVVAEALRQMRAEQIRARKRHVSNQLAAVVNAPEHLVMFCGVVDPCLNPPVSRTPSVASRRHSGSVDDMFLRESKFPGMTAVRAPTVQDLEAVKSMHEKADIMAEVDRLRGEEKRRTDQTRLRAFYEPSQASTSRVQVANVRVLNCGVGANPDRHASMFDIDLGCAVSERVVAAEAALCACTRLCDMMDYADTVTLSPAILSDVPRLFSVLNLVSRGKFLTEVCRVYWFSSDNQWRWVAPQWFRDQVLMFSLARYLCLRLELVLWEKFWQFSRADPRSEAALRGRTFAFPSRNISSLLDKQQLVEFWESLNGSSRRKALGSIRDKLSMARKKSPTSKPLRVLDRSDANGEDFPTFDDLDLLVDLVSFLDNSKPVKSFDDSASGGRQSHHEACQEVEKVLEQFSGAVSRRAANLANSPGSRGRQAASSGADQSVTRRPVRSGSAGTLTPVAMATKASSAGALPRSPSDSRATFLDHFDVEQSLVYVLYFSPLSRVGTAVDRVLRGFGRAIGDAVLGDVPERTLDAGFGATRKSARKARKQQRKNAQRKVALAVPEPVSTEPKPVDSDVAGETPALSQNGAEDQVSTSSAPVHSNQRSRRKNTSVNMSVNDRSRRHRSVSPQRGTAPPDRGGDLDDNQSEASVSESQSVQSVSESTHSLRSSSYAEPRDLSASASLSTTAGKDRAISEWEYFLGLAAQQYSASRASSGPGSILSAKSDSDLDTDSDSDGGGSLPEKEQTHEPVVPWDGWGRSSIDRDSSASGSVHLPPMQQNPEALGGHPIQFGAVKRPANATRSRSTADLNKEAQVSAPGSTPPRGRLAPGETLRGAGRGVPKAKGSLGSLGSSAPMTWSSVAKQGMEPSRPDTDTRLSRVSSERVLPPSSAWASGAPAARDRPRDDFETSAPSAAFGGQSYYEQQWFKLHGQEPDPEEASSSSQSSASAPHRSGSSSKVTYQSQEQRDSQWTNSRSRHLAPSPKNATSATTYTGHSAAAGLLQHHSPQGTERARSSSIDRSRPLRRSVDTDDAPPPPADDNTLFVAENSAQPEAVTVATVQPSVLDNCARRLHEEISEYMKITQWVMDLRTEHCIEPVFQQIEAVVHKLWPGRSSAKPPVTVSRYGSYSTGLCIPSSDIDLVIMFDQEQMRNAPRSGPDALPKDEKVAFRRLAQALSSQPWVQQLQRIETARVPVIKLLALPITGAALPPRPGGSGQHLKIYEYPPTAWVEVDVTFADSETVFVCDAGLVPHQGIAAVDYVKKHLVAFPALKPLVIVLKEFLCERGMNIAFMGGLSSYCLVVMCISFLQQKAAQGEAVDQDIKGKRLGKLFLELLEYYGHFDYALMGIKTGSGGGAFKLPEPNAGDAPRPPMVIVDPHDPGNNIAPRVYAISRIKELFEQALFVLLAPFYAAFTPASLLRRLVGLPHIDDWMLRAADSPPPRLVYTHTPRGPSGYGDVGFHVMSRSENSPVQSSTSQSQATVFREQSPHDNAEHQGVFGPSAVNWASSAAAAAAAHHRKGTSSSRRGTQNQSPADSHDDRETQPAKTRRRGTSLGDTADDPAEPGFGAGAKLWSQVAVAPADSRAIDARIPEKPSEKSPETSNSAPS